MNCPNGEPSRVDATQASCEPAFAASAGVQDVKDGVCFLLSKLPCCRRGGANIKALRVSTWVSTTDAARMHAKRLWPTTRDSNLTCAAGTVAHRRPSKADQGARTSCGLRARSWATNAAVEE